MKVICSVFCFILLLPLFSYGQTQNRTIDFPPNAPEGNFIKGENGKLIPSIIKALEIVEIKLGDKPISLGQPFSASDDWLKNLTIKLRNISDKPIYSIMITFSLPEAQYKDFILPEAQYKDFMMGKSLEHWRPGRTYMPDEEFNLPMDFIFDDRGMENIVQKTGVTTFSKLIVGNPTAVRFQDDTVWFSWKLPFAKQEN